MSDYAKMLKSLRAMDETCLLEMFHDFVDCETGEGLEIVKLIGETAAHFIENYVAPEIELEGEDEAEDWKAQDDSQRYNDYKSDERSPW